ncbi:hypothetical protein [Methylobacterium goesingense]|uniref:TerB family tellurite resistance protein n=1 Tax=Methylobacterium goesingense TaxID=243690 RepID=A0ABV2L9A1_9HYPH|nr:hypothetical protein [Methylobacterium goesingense]GJD74915.1 hypothetical protein CFIICLFH_3155 [Methylobacterium goesingense]
MSALTLAYATIRYRDAGLCDESQRGILAATLGRNEASIAALDQAVANSAPLTLAQFDALADQDLDISDQTRYGIALGHFDERINDFAMMADELAEVTARCLKRGTPMTEAEIVWLARNVEPGLVY